MSSELAQRKASVLRHHLRTAAHRVVRDSELLLLETNRPERRLWSEPVGQAVLAGHAVRSIVERWFHSPDIAHTPADIASMNSELREPQQRILKAMTAVLGLVPSALYDELLLDDVRNIRDAALSLGNCGPVMDTKEAGEPHDRSTPAGTRRRTPAGEGRAVFTPRLLVVDDSPGSRTLLVTLLERMNYEVVAVSDGMEALAVVRNQRIDTVLSDIRMPHMDGIALLKELKADDATRDIPVIMVSGVDDVPSVVRCITEGAEDHIGKPFSQVLLRARVHASLERKRLRDDELAYLRRVAELTAAAKAVETETYEPGSLEHLAGTDDELGRFARLFDQLVSGIRAKEHQLQRRLGQLKRDISHSRSSDAMRAPIAEANSLAPGFELAGRYEIREELGRGGMGVVYRAFDRKLSEDVAVKIVRKVISGDPTVIERLKSEIRLARRITHPNVVRIHDFGEANGEHYLTMEYVKGITVRSLLDTRGRLSVASTLAIGAQLTAALVIAHEHSVLHRDIKPANLLLNDAGVLKLMDFGLARTIEMGGEITLLGTIVGTPRYIAPEQLLGGVVDARSDLFALGVVLYECLTGLPPFDEGAPITVVARMIDGPPIAVLSLVPDVPPALALLVERLLQFEPAQRPQSASEVGDRLKEVT